MLGRVFPAERRADDDSTTKPTATYTPTYVEHRPDQGRAIEGFTGADDARSCVVVVDLPVATEHEVVCGEEGEWYGQNIWWTSGGALDVVLYETGGPFVATFDPTRGASSSGASIA